MRSLTMLDRHTRFRPRLERLEERATPSTFLVTNLQDSGLGSLRWAMNQANSQRGGDVILFSQHLAGQTIQLTSGPLVARDPTGSTTVAAPGEPVRVGRRISSNPAMGPGITVNVRLHNHSAFQVLARARLNLAGLTITGGHASWGAFTAYYSGGGIFNAGTLTVSNCTLSRNFSTYDLFQYEYYPDGSKGSIITAYPNKGGAIYNRGYMVLMNCTLLNNGWDQIDNRGTAIMINNRVNP